MLLNRLPLLLACLALPLTVACDSGLPGTPVDDCRDGKCDAPGDPDAGQPLVYEARISPETITLTVGEEVQFSVWIVDADERKMTDTGSPQYSAVGEIASVATDGTLSAIAPGETVVTALLQGLEVQATVTVKAEGGDDVEVTIDPAVCCPAAVRGPEDKNFCFLPPNTAGCPMTFGDGYCDEDDDQNYSTPDANYPACESDGTGCHSSAWVQGYTDAMALCGDYSGEEETPSGEASEACCALAADPNGPTDNICDVPPSSGACAPTLAGGYCDPNGDGSYVDGDWDRGYGDYLALCD